MGRGAGMVEGETRDELKRLVSELRQRVSKLEASEARLKEAEERLREQTEFVKKTIESLSHPFYVIDAEDYTIELANSAALQTFSDVPNDTTCFILTHRRAKPCAELGELCPLEEVKKTKQAVTVEHVHYDKDGNARIYEVHAHPILNGEGNVVQMIEYSLDVTERKKAEEELKVLKELNENVVQSIQDGLATLDRDLRITTWNKAMERISGYEAEEVLGKSAPELFPHVVEEGVVEMYEAVLEGRIAGRSNIPFKTPKGKTGYTNNQYLPLRNHQGEVVGVLAVVEDVTEARRREQEVAHLQEELERRKLIEVAKGILMRELSLGEAESFRFMQKKSQDESRKMTDVARQVIGFFGSTRERRILD